MNFLKKKNIHQLLEKHTGKSSHQWTTRVHGWIRYEGWYLFPETEKMVLACINIINEHRNKPSITNVTTVAN